NTTGRPVPRLLSEMPSLDNGGLLLTPDGKLIATYKLRPDVSWPDGAPFSSKDLLLSFKTVKNPSLPIIDTGPAELMGSLARPADAVINPEQAANLKERWAVDGGGKVFVGTGTTQFVAIQFETTLPGYQPALQDKRVRQALYQAIDRQSYAEAAAGGMPGTAA